MKKSITGYDIGIFLPHVEQIGVMGFNGSVSNAVLNHHSAKVELHRVHDSGSNAATGGAAHDDRGVNPICTYLPAACSLHNITLTDALALGKPIAYLVGTPAHCSTGTCSPALEALLQVSQKLSGSMTFIHAEIYTDDTATVVAPAVEALNMTYEPALFITDAQGIVIERLDAVFDADEINEVLVTLGLQ